MGKSKVNDDANIAKAAPDELRRGCCFNLDFI